jgi:riboflavin kinase/FMN adenylyltransferase
VEVVRPDQCVPPVRGSAVTIGAYDGVHLGHRHLLGVLADHAAARGLMTAVVTFDRHPATVVRPESAPPVLTDLPQKLELLGASGIERTLVVPFDVARAAESPEDFVAEVLVGLLGARLVVVGQDFHFGRGRSGNVALLQSLGSVDGFEVVGIGLHDQVGQAVSSTRVRALLAAGDVAGAAVLLGRPHQVRGTVERGDGRGGTELGYPTANVAVPSEILLPADGIYAGWYGRADGSVHRAAISVGRRPTFYEQAERPLVEAYLLDTSADLYGEAARVSFVARLRPEERFDTVAALVAQMGQDVARAGALLGAAPPAS